MRRRRGSLTLRRDLLRHWLDWTLVHQKLRLKVGKRSVWWGRRCVCGPLDSAAYPDHDWKLVEKSPWIEMISTRTFLVSPALSVAVAHRSVALAGVRGGRTCEINEF